MKVKFFLTLLMGFLSLLVFSQPVTVTPSAGYPIVKSTVKSYIVPITTPTALSINAWTSNAIDDTSTFVVNLSYDGLTYFPVYDTVFVPSDTAFIHNMVLMGGKRIKYTYTTGPNDSTGTLKIWHQPNKQPAVNFYFGHDLGLTPTP